MIRSIVRYWHPEQPVERTYSHQHYGVPGWYMRGLILLLLGMLYAMPVSAATPQLVGSEITALLTRLETSDCEFNRNGIWYSATEAKAHLQFKFGAAGSFQSTEQFIERVASKSSMSGKPYLVRCGNSAPVQSGEWLFARLQELRSAPLEGSASAATAAVAAQLRPGALTPDDRFVPPSDASE